MFKAIFSYVIVISFVLIHGCAKDGLDGQDGLKSLIRIEIEPEGSNCMDGGYQVHSGIDLNSNDTLDDNEIQVSEYICHGIDAYYDKQVIIPFIGVNNLSTNSTTGIVSSARELPGFNINNYPGADSIVFGGFPRSADGIDCIVQLYDKTNDRIIENSMLISRETGLVWHTTYRNFINKLPKETIDLAIFIQSGQNGKEVLFKEPTLIIYKY